MGSNTTDTSIGGGNDNINASMGASAGPTGASAHGPKFNVKGENYGAYLESASGQLGAQTDKNGTTQVGAQLNAMGAGGTYDSDTTSARFGVGLGVGGGARVHDDGNKQGFGIDAGPFSMDYSSTTFGENVSRFGDFMATGGRSQGMKW